MNADRIPGGRGQLRSRRRRNWWTRTARVGTTLRRGSVESKPCAPRPDTIPELHAAVAFRACTAGRGFRCRERTVWRGLQASRLSRRGSRGQGSAVRPPRVVRGEPGHAVAVQTSRSRRGSTVGTLAESRGSGTPRRSTSPGCTRSLPFSSVTVTPSRCCLKRGLAT